MSIYRGLAATTLAVFAFASVAEARPPRDREPRCPPIKLGDTVGSKPCKAPKRIRKRP